MIEFLNTVSLGLFFLYFVLLSGSCGDILNCGLQRYVNNSSYMIEDDAMTGWKRGGLSAREIARQQDKQ